jgi:hypothetical protein
MKIYKFWFGCRQFESTEQFMTMGEIVKMTNASPLNMCFQDLLGRGRDRSIGHGERVDYAAGSPERSYCSRGW